MKNKPFIHKTSEVSSSSKIGEGTFVWNHSQIRENSKIGTNCVISKDVYVDEGVTIGNNVKIQNGVSVYKGVTIEDDVFLGPHSVLTNDLVPRAFNKEWAITETILRKGCSIGANATIVAGNIIGVYAMVAAGSVVTESVPPFTLVRGNPARIVSFICESGHKLEQTNKKDESALYFCEKCKIELSFNFNINHV